MLCVKKFREKIMKNYFKIGGTAEFKLFRPKDRIEIAFCFVEEIKKERKNIYE